MKLYRVSVHGFPSYTLKALSIAHAVAFTRHWTHVRIQTIKPLAAV